MNISFYVDPETEGLPLALPVVREQDHELSTPPVAHMAVMLFPLSSGLKIEIHGRAATRSPGPVPEITISLYHEG